MKKRYKNWLLGVSFLILAWGCAGVEEYSPIGGYSLPKSGVYHKVQKGETLWRIAKTYQVDIEEIVQSNSIPNVAHIENNQLIFIPGAISVKTIPSDREDTNSKEFVWPIKGSVVRYFGRQNDGQVNNGIGIRTHEGEVVHASRSGRVVFADYLSGYGYAVILDHQDGFFSVYCQNSVLLCRLGDHVVKGDSVAQIGKFGDLVYAHFEIRQGDRARNPLYYLP